MSRQRWGSRIASVVLVALLLPGCNGGRKAPPPPVREVATVTVEPQRVLLTTDLPGRTSPRLIAEIRPQVSGLIQERLFTEGADVKAGELLYRIDPSIYQATCDKAEAAVAAARADLAVAQAAVAAAKAGHATARAARDTARTALLSARANRARAEANVVPLRLRDRRFRELLASKAVSQQDCDDVAAALKEAEAEIESAKAAVQGAEAEVVRSEAAIQVAEADVRRAEAAVQGASAAIQSAEAMLEAARIDLGYTRITSPISGRIGRSAVTTGALVTAHQPLALATVQQLDPIYVDVPQSTAELLRLERRLADGRLTRDAATTSRVQLILEDGTVYPLEGTLQFRDVSVEPTTGSVILRMVFPNPEAILLPGMFVRTRVKEGVDEEAILIPQQAVSHDTKGNPLVWIVDASAKARVRSVTVDRAVGARWLVSAGLVPGDRVIVEGLQKVRPGSPVKEVPFAAGEKENPSPRQDASVPAPKSN
jgi:membrane fusion protein (multidrug efflux system)